MYQIITLTYNKIKKKEERKRGEMKHFSWLVERRNRKEKKKSGGTYHFLFLSKYEEKKEKYGKYVCISIYTPKRHYFFVRSSF